MAEKTSEGSQNFPDDFVHVYRIPENGCNFPFPYVIILLLFFERKRTPMEEFLNALAEINNAVKDFVWVKIGLVLLIGTGIIMTVLTGFFRFPISGHGSGKRSEGFFTAGLTIKREEARFRSFRRSAPPLPRRSEREISRALLRRLRSADPARFSGCGSRRFSE